MGRQGQLCMPEPEMTGTCSPCPLQLEQGMSWNSHLATPIWDLDLEVLPQRTRVIQKSLHQGGVGIQQLWQSL